MKRLLLVMVFVLLLMFAGCAEQELKQEPKQVEPVVSVDILENIDDTAADGAVDDTVEEDDASDIEVIVEDNEPETTSVTEKQEEEIVEIRDMKFIPEVLEIEPGTKVRWTNYDSEAHLIDSEEFTSKYLTRGGVFTYTFDTPGDYEYECTIHPEMTGKVIVR